MKTRFFCLAMVLFYAGTVRSQDTVLLRTDTFTHAAPTVVQVVPAKREHMYKLNPAVDIPIVAVGTGWSIFAFSQIYSKDPSTPEQIMNLDKNDIPKFDRWAAGMSDETAANNSDYIFYGSIPVPFLLLLDKDIREDAPRIGMLYWEAMAITGMFYTGGVYFVDRYRPEAYDTTIPVSQRTSGNFKDAFPGGHPSLVATTMFFTAKVYADYHPESSFKYVMYGLAIGATGTTAYLRHLAGKHFPSDLLAGITVGTLSGILVPQLHKTHLVTENVGFVPYTNGKDFGFAFRYRIK